MSNIFNGRYTAKTNQPFVVFLLGLLVWHMNMILAWGKVENRRMSWIGARLINC